MAIAFVQTNNATPASGSPITVTYTGAQTAGNTNIVAIGWGDNFSTISSVTDTKGNSYQVAAARVAEGSGLSQAIYYAKNIIVATANANTVTVTFSASVPFPDIRIQEYSGLSTTAPLDSGATASGTGSSASPSAGPVSTTTANELLFAAGMTGGAFNAPGSGYTQRVITANGDIVEDLTVSSTGSYTATAALSGSNNWIFQVVAFLVATATPTGTNQFFAVL